MRSSPGASDSPPRFENSFSPPQTHVKPSRDSSSNYRPIKPYKRDEHIPPGSSAKKARVEGDGNAANCRTVIVMSMEAGIQALKGKRMNEGMNSLIFPDIGGRSCLSVNLSHAQGFGIANVMVVFEQVSLAILRHRLSVEPDFLLKRIPTRVKAHITKDECFRPWFLRRKIPRSQIGMSAEEFRREVLLPEHIKSLHPGNESHTSDTGETVKVETTSSRDETSTCSEQTNESEPLTIFLGDREDTYPPALTNYYLAEELVRGDHEQRYESLNSRFDFITRSLLWCLRSGSSSRTGRNEHRDPKLRSIELNADVFNVWMVLLQEDYFPMTVSLTKEIIEIERAKESENNRTKIVKNEKSVAEVKSKQNTNLVEYDISEDESSSPVSPPLQVNDQIIPEPRIPMVLFLSSDFMTQFEHALRPQEVDAADGKGIHSNVLTWSGAESKERIKFVLEVESSGGLNLAFAKVFRFFRRRNWNIWDYDYVCWPINYLSSHWVLLVSDMRNHKLIWMDSYRDCYVQALATWDVQRSFSRKGGFDPRSEGEETSGEEGAMEGSLEPCLADRTKNTGAVTRDAFREFFGEEDASSSAAGKGPPEYSENDDWDKIGEQALQFTGWIHFLCVESYLKYDLRQRKQLSRTELTPIEEEILAKVWPRECIEGLPQQSLASLDCGVYAAQFARCIAEYGSPYRADFDARSVPFLRRAMAVLIGRGGIPPCPQELIQEMPTGCGTTPSRKSAR